MAWHAGVSLFPAHHDRSRQQVPFLARAKNLQNPDPLFKVLEHYGLEPHQALFVGDSQVDRQAAEAAGVPFVAYKADMPAVARTSRHDEILSLL